MPPPVEPAQAPKNDKKIRKFIGKVDLITYEFENIPTNSLKIIEKSIPIFPPISALKITQDRVKEKKFFKDNNLSLINISEHTRHSSIAYSDF